MHKARHGGGPIGAHTGVRQPESRLGQHSCLQNKDRSIFRKNIGHRYLHRAQYPYGQDRPEKSSSEGQFAPERNRAWRRKSAATCKTTSPSPSSGLQRKRSACGWNPASSPLSGMRPLGQLAGPPQPQGENPPQRPLAGERAGQNAPYPRRFRAALWQHPQIVPIKIPHCRCLWGIFCGILLTHNVPCGTIYIKQRRRGCEFGRMAGAD